MRIPAFARFLPLFLVIASPAFLLAQFQQPTAEELKMTADPKAPGAAAVYFNVEEFDNDPLHYQSVYVRIKVLQEKGKELPPSSCLICRATPRSPASRAAPFTPTEPSFRSP